jgi:hypothetical protein
MIGLAVNVQMTREPEDKDPVDLPVEVEIDGSSIWIYVSKEDILVALEKEE